MINCIKILEDFMNYHKIKNKILLMLFVLTTVIFSVILFVQYKIEQNAINDMVQTERDKLQNVYATTLENFYLMYRSLGTKLLTNQEVIKAVKDNDRTKLYNLTKAFYDELKEENKYFHNMHFHTKDSVSILRLHLPKKFGDDLSKSRPMIVAVNKQKKILQGVEVGKHAISFRVAFPIFYESEHVGSLEFGIKIDYLTNLFASKYNTNSFFVFHNDALKYLFQYSKDKIPHITLKNISLFQFNNCTMPKDISYDKIDEVLHQKKIYHVKNSNIYLSEISKIKNYDNTPMGHIVFQIDMTPFIEKTYTYRISIIVSIVLFISILFFMLNRWFGFFVHVVDNNHKKLEELSQKDELTKLYNRRKITEVITKEFERSKRYDIENTLCIFDIDHFKHINDTYGHNIGDEVLKELSQLLQSSIRKTDSIGRWGGEEFILIATQTNLNESQIFIETLRKKIETHNFHKVGKVTCSFGVTNLGVANSFTEAINNADTALYEAKDTGRNKVIIHEV